MRTSLAVFGLIPFFAITCATAHGQLTKTQMCQQSFTVDGNFDGAALEMRGKTLLLQVPGRYRDLWPIEGAVNAPRVMHAIDGDFSVQVEVGGEMDVAGHPRGDDVTSPVSPAFRAATLLIWQGKGDFVRLEHASGGNGDDSVHYCYYHVFRDGKRIVHQHKFFDNKPKVLRLERVNGWINAAWRQADAMEWHTLPRYRSHLADDVSVGVSAINTTAHPFSATFADLRIQAVDSEP